ncbi:YxeA family protein [Lacticaseibacillus paracasei]|jgi:uncharacterized protein (TIGR01655 family)|uniref:YxeA family protein n=1 Tax=Lacticaseibacillus paracasei TaxID=1597 RepID=UPI00189C1F3E|nr:YxeA family protein [Lacticaseibacillus paracasei]MDN6022460.1 YxeA family protein [Lactobacillus sp.]MDP4467260.1 YxeA family protein [Lacticaseibacillus paracasei]
MHTTKLYRLNMFATLIGIVIFSAFIAGFYYSGANYYMKIKKPVQVTQIDFPIHTTLIGYLYKGIARSPTGKQRLIKFSATLRKGTDLKNGDIVQLTYNKYYGVVRYQKVDPNEVPKKVNLED